MCGEEILVCEDACEALDKYYDSDRPEILDLLYGLAPSFPIDTDG